MHHPTLSKSEYRADIDGLRALAVLSVFLYHLQPSLLPGGFLGVDVFFVISGYLITGIIVRKNHLHTFSFINFYARRVKRIFPALFVVLILSSFTAVFLLLPDAYLNFMKSARYASLQISNFLFSWEVGYFSEGFSRQPLLHTWSLGVEEQFYLFWPLLIFLCFLFLNKFRSVTLNNSLEIEERGAVGSQSIGKAMDYDTGPVENKAIAGVFFLLFLFSIAACYILAEKDYNLAFYMFYSRGFEFCVGGLISLGILSVPKTKGVNCLIGVLGILLLCYSMFFIREEYLGRSFLQFGVLVPCIGAALIIHADWKKSVINRFLSTTIPSHVGKISYSLYLYHWPIIVYWKLIGNTSELGWIASLGIILVTFILSTLSYLFVEQPARKSKVPDYGVLISAIIVIIGFTVIFNNLETCKNAPWRITPYVNEQSHITKRYSSGCKAILKNGVEIFQCGDDSESSRPIIALVGDSHAPHFLDSTIAWAAKYGYDVKYFAVAGCPMLLGDVRIKSQIEDGHGKLCEDSVSLFETQIVNDPRVEVILLAQRFDLFHNGKGYLDATRKITFKDTNGRVVKDHTGYYRDQLSYTVKTIQKMGKELIILKQVPIFSNIDACTWEPRLKKLFSQGKVCDYDTNFINKWQQPSIDFIDNFSTEYRVDVFDPVSYIDNPLQDGVILYKDRDHLNEDGSQFLVPYLEKAINDIMDQKKLR